MKLKFVNKKNDIVVIGIGRFGLSVVEQLVTMNCYVMAIDLEEKNLVPIAQIANQAIVADGSNIEALQELGIKKFDTVVVGTANNIEIVATLLEIGVKNIIAKANSKRHERVLRQIGVDIIVRPEAEAGFRTAFIAINTKFIKYFENLQEIGNGYALGTTILQNHNLINKSLKQLNFTARDVSIVLVKRGSKVTIPSGELKLEKDDRLTIIGKIVNIVQIFEEIGSSMYDKKPQTKK